MKMTKAIRKSESGAAGFVWVRGLLALLLMFRSTPASMRSRAIAQAGGHSGGLDFPGEEQPHDADFHYFSAIIGSSAQTADVGLSSRTMRRVGLVHCVLAFFFNATLLALTINIVSGLI